MFVHIKKILTGFLLLFELLQAGSYAQPFYFRHYQVENGLSNNAAISCLQDKKGFMWFGTKDGLNRFDGYTFKVFRNEPGDTTTIGSNFVHCLFEDNHGILWVGTENGLYSYNEKTESFSLLKVSANAPVSHISMDSKGNLWYIQAFTLYKWQNALKRIQAYPNTEYFEASSLCITKNGSVWASSPNGNLYQYVEPADSFRSYNVFFHSQKVTTTWIEKIVAAKDGSIMIGTADGAKFFNTKSGDYSDILRFTSEKTPVFVRNFLEANENEVCCEI